MTKRRAMLLCLVVGASALIGCSGSVFGTALLDEIVSRNGNNVRLDAVFRGDWTHFLVICPYDQAIDERLGFAWPDAPDTAASDSSEVLVFVRNDAVVSTARVFRTDVDFCGGVWRLQPSSASLDFEKTAEGTWVTTAPD